MLQRAPDKMNTKKKRLAWLGPLLRIFATAILLAWLLYQIEIDRLATLLLDAPLMSWLSAYLLVLAGVYISSVKLALLLRVLRIRAALHELLRIYLAGTFLGNFLPSTVGGDVVKFAYLQRRAPRRTDLLIALFMERYLGLMALMASAAAASFFADASLLPAWGEALLIAGAAAAWLFVFAGRYVRPFSEPALLAQRPRLQKVYGLYGRAHDAAVRLGRHNGAMASGLALSFLFVFAGTIAVSWVFLAGLGFPLPLWDITLITCLVQVITMLPISFNGVGLREWSYVYFLAQIGVPAEAATAASLMIYFTVLGVSLLGGLVFAFGLESDTRSNAL